MNVDLVLARRDMAAACQDWALVAEIDDYLGRLGHRRIETATVELERAVEPIARRGPGRPRKTII